MKLLARILLVAVLTVGLLAAWVASLGGRDADWTGMGRALRNASAPLLLAAAGLQLASILVRTERWRVLLATAGAGKQAPTRRDLVTATGLGFAVTFALPGRLGEVLRPALLSARTSVPFATALASVALERLLDMGVLLLMVLGFAALRPGVAPAGFVPGAGIGVLALAGAMAAGAWMMARRPQLAHGLVARLAGLLPSRAGAAVRRLGEAFLSGFDVLRVPGAWWRLPAWSLLTWTPPLLALFLALRAAGVQVGPADPLLLLPLTAAGIALPTPAGVGGYHALLTWGIVDLLHHPAPLAGAAAIVAHLSCVVPVLAFGLYLLAREGLTLAGLKQAVASARSQPEVIPDSPR